MEDMLLQVKQLLEEKNYVKLKSILDDMNPADIALLLENIAEDELPLIFRILSKEIASDTFVEMSSDSQELLINAFSDTELKAVIEDMFLDDTVDIIEEMPANVVRRILNQANPDTRSAINELLQYPKDSAGTIMTVEYISLKSNMTVKQCFDHIRKNAINKETIYTCYVTDPQRKLLGLVSVKDLLLNTYETVVGDIMETNVIYAFTSTDKEEVAGMFSKYGFSALPIVDNEQRLVGIVTIDDAIDVLEEETTEDITKMAAIIPTSTDKPYLETSVWKLWASRIPWLLILLISATFTGLIINNYESTLNMPIYGIILTACIPMLMDSGGNAGSQACVTVIRSIALGELQFKDLFKVIWKELRVSFLVAIVMGIGCFAKLQIIDRLIVGNAGYTVELSLIVSVALMATVIIAKFIGCTLPILAKKIHLDPAVVASPIITTIVDAVSLMIYCSIAIAILS